MRFSRMAVMVADEKKEREALKARRNLLFQRYLKTPQDTRLALEIKLIDDQVAEFTKQRDRKRASKN
jgi:hypothetical protein